LNLLGLRSLEVRRIINRAVIVIVVEVRILRVAELSR